MRLQSMFAVSALSVLVACGLSGGEDAASSEGAVQGGKADTSASFAVGVRAGGSVCSGVLIAPNVVLTARHCVAPGTEGAVDCRIAKFGRAMPPRDVSVTTAPRITSALGNHRVEQIFVPNDERACGADLALLLLTSPIAASEARPARPAVGFSMSDRSRVGVDVTVIGYGSTSARTEDQGTRRIRRNVPITCIPGDPKLGCVSESDREFETEGSVCGGDSGSGAFDTASLDRGDPLVLGVLSRGLTFGRTCGDATYSRTDRWSEFLSSVTRVAASRGNYPVPPWAVRITDAGVDADADAAPAPDAAADAGAVPDAAADASTELPSTSDESSNYATDPSSSSSSESDRDPPSDEEADAGPSSSSSASGCSTSGRPGLSLWAPALVAAALFLGRRRRR